MRVLVCKCGRTRVGVPRKQKHCSTSCPFAHAAVKAATDKARAERTRRALARVAHMTPAQAWKHGYQRGYAKGERLGIAKGYAAACGERWKRGA